MSAEAAGALHERLDRAAAEWPERVAVVDGDRRATYAELRRAAGALRDRLWASGVRPGERVGLCLRKSFEAVAAVFGILKTGAAYVPLDPESPASRNAYVARDCGLRILVADAAWQAKLAREPDAAAVRCVAPEAAGTNPPAPPVATRPDQLAYVLYTSGSTGRPKGVMVSHDAALAFVDWCSDAFRPTREDCFSSHAPLHFDLSIHDLFVPVQHGAAVVLFDAESGRQPRLIAERIARERVSVWYSTPSALMALAEFGRLEEHDLGSLRAVLFAGEVFPAAPLRRLAGRLPQARLYNLYGPTETNVCTWHELPRPIPPERAEPFPIGEACSHARVRLVDADGADVPDDRRGEILVAGPSLMAGYWNLPEASAQACVRDAAGVRWYRTGDLAWRGREGLVFAGRRDRMVKRRGHRVELAEVEAGLQRHPDVREAAALARPDAEGGVRLEAVLALREGGRLGVVELKRFCSSVLPHHMVPDVFSFRERMPRTSTGKLDYEALKGA